MCGTVTAVSSNAEYSFAKPDRDSIRLLAGLGVEGDVHAGVAHEELFAEVDEAGFAVAPGELGENITTRGIDLLGLPVGTLLRIGDEAVLEVTGLRNPCLQIDSFQDGLLKQVVGRDEDGNIVRRAGISGQVWAGLCMSLAYIRAVMAAMSGAPQEQAGLASGIVNTTYQVGSALGLAGLTALATSKGAGLREKFGRGLALVGQDNLRRIVGVRRRGSGPARAATA